MSDQPRPARLCCLDLDTFFVSVERLLDPTLIGKPVIVGAAPGRRGVVTAASYEVRPLGVRSGISMTQARKLAPHAVYVPTRHGVYSDYAAQVRTVLEDFTPEVRTASIDEFFLDFRGCERLYRREGDRSDDHTIERTVVLMRSEIQRRVGLPASAGIGAARSVAKMASNMAKPAGVWMVPGGDEIPFVVELPVRAMPGIGPVAEARLLAAGIETLGALLHLPAGPTRARFGALARSVRARLLGGNGRLGRDRPAFREHDRPGLTVGSISNERTFHADVADRQGVHQQAARLAERVCWRARKRGILARTVTLKLRYADFDTRTRSSSRRPTHDDRVVRRSVAALLEGLWTRPLPIRLIGVQLSNLERSGGQLQLPWSGERPALGSAIDAVRDRHGYEAIRHGALPKPGSTWLADSQRDTAADAPEAEPEEARM